MHRWANSCDGGTKEMEFGLLDSGDVGKISRISLVEISKNICDAERFLSTPPKN